MVEVRFESEGDYCTNVQHSELNHKLLHEILM
jgi:hypothetical protein